MYDRCIRCTHAAISAQEKPRFPIYRVQTFVVHRLDFSYIVHTPQLYIFPLRNMEIFFCSFFSSFCCGPHFACNAAHSPHFRCRFLPVFLFCSANECAIMLWLAENEKIAGETRNVSFSSLVASARSLDRDMCNAMRLGKLSALTRERKKSADFDRQ